MRFCPSSLPLRGGFGRPRVLLFVCVPNPIPAVFARLFCSFSVSRKSSGKSALTASINISFGRSRPLPDGSPSFSPALSFWGGGGGSSPSEACGICVARLGNTSSAPISRSSASTDARVLAMAFAFATLSARRGARMEEMPKLSASIDNVRISLTEALASSVPAAPSGICKSVSL